MASNAALVFTAEELTDQANGLRWNALSIDTLLGVSAAVVATDHCVGPADALVDGGTVGQHLSNTVLSRSAAEIFTTFDPVSRAEFLATNTNAVLACRVFGAYVATNAAVVVIDHGVDTVAHAGQHSRLALAELIFESGINGVNAVLSRGVAADITAFGLSRIANCLMWHAESIDAKVGPEAD